MPTLPSPDNVQRVGFDRPRGIVQADPGIENRLAAGALVREQEASQNLIGAVSGVAERIATAADKERVRLNNLKRDDAENQLLGRITDLSLKAQQVKMGDVLKPGYAENFGKEFDSAAKEVRDSLSNEDQKQAFSVSSDRARIEFMRGVAVHAMRETDSYNTQVHETRKDAIRNFAASQPLNPEVTESALAMMEASIRIRAQELGVTDENSVEQMLLEENGALHSSVIDAARSQGYVKQALEYAQANEGQMTPDQFVKVMDRLKPAVSVELGKEVGNAAFAMLESGKFKNVDAEKYIDENTKGDGQATSAARSVVLERRQAQEMDYRESAGGIMTRFLASPNMAEARNRLLISEDFANLSSSWKERVMKDMDSQLAVSVGRAKKVDSGQWDTEEATAKYFDLTEELKDTNRPLPSVNQLTALRSEIGPKKVEKLLSLHKERMAGTQRFNIAAEILNDAIPKQLLKSANKDKLNAFRGIVESNLADWKTANPGQVPTLDDQRKIARSALTEYEEKGILWGTNKKPLYEAPPEEREQRRLSAQRPEWEAKMRRDAQERGIVLTSEKLEEMWQRKLAKVK